MGKKKAGKGPGSWEKGKEEGVYPFFFPGPLQ